MLGNELERGGEGIKATTKKIDQRLKIQTKCNHKKNGLENVVRKITQN